MNHAALWHELHAAARNLTPAHLTRLQITQADALAAGGLGAARATPLDSGVYEPEGDVTVALLPVFAGTAPASGGPRLDKDLIDILAFRRDAPEEFWLRRGDGVFLQEGALDDLWLDAPLRVHRTPLGWLRAGAQGCAVLNWRSAAPRLRCVTTINADDQAHARDIHRRLQQPAVLPDIRYPENRVAA